MVDKGAPPEEDFNPTGTVVLMIGYIIIFALAWGSVYFFDLLGRR
jgi:hypothetical protein